MERVVMPADKLKKIDAATNYHPTSHHFEHGHEENGTFDEKQPPVVFMILNSAVVDKFGRGYTSFYMSKGLIRKVIESCRKRIGGGDKREREKLNTGTEFNMFLLFYLLICDFAPSPFFVANTKNI